VCRAGICVAIATNTVQHWKRAAPSGFSFGHPAALFVVQQAQEIPVVLTMASAKISGNAATLASSFMRLRN
jgi:alpha/beta superfamily hydrolase